MAILSDEKVASLTRRLVDTVIDYKKEAERLTIENETLRAALLTGVCMLSEMGLDPREKCQMAYDYMSAALKEKSK